MDVLQIENYKNHDIVLIDTGAVIDGYEIQVWVDVFESEGELTADWNMYIFDLSNTRDLAYREYQESAENFDACSSLAIAAIENQKG
jgi:hypothetical protein